MLGVSVFLCIIELFEKIFNGFIIRFVENQGANYVCLSISPLLSTFLLGPSFIVCLLHAKFHSRAKSIDPYQGRIHDHEATQLC